MAQVIIHTTENGNVAVTVPTGEISIQEVLAKDCPGHAAIVDDSTLPQGADAQFFDAWELVDGKVLVNFTKAQVIKLAQFNAGAVAVAQKRQLNTLAGIDNDIADADFANELKIGRDAIASAKTTDDLALIANPV
jgi:hypothetical protein